MRIIALSKAFAYFVGLTVLFTGSLVFFVGWGLDVGALKRILPGLGIMQPNTALGFVLAGLSLWILCRPPVVGIKSAVSAACAISIGLIGLITLGEYLFDWPSVLDRMFFSESTAALQAVDPGRMSPNTALNFVFIGGALLLIDRKSANSHFLAQVFSFAAGFIALLSLTGYAYEAVPLYRVVNFTQMAVHTAGAFALLSLGVVLSRPDRGVMVTMTSDRPGGVLLRRLLPAVIVIPLVVGWLRLAGERAGFYGTEFGAAMMVVLTILVFEILIWRNAAAFDRMVADRRRVEEERDRFFNLTLDMMCIAGFDGYFKHLNPAWEKTLGWTVEELCARPYLEFIHPDDRKMTANEADKNAGGEATLVFENRYLCKDGSHRWFQWKALPLKDRGLIFATARDVTEEKKMGAERDQFFNLSPDLLAIGGFDGYIKQINPSWERILGWSEPEILTTPYREIIHPDDRESAVRELEKLSGGGRTAAFENRFRCKDGSYRVFQWMATPLPEQGLIYAAARDITDRRRAEEKFRLAIEAAPNGMVLVNREGKIILSNSQAEKMFGYSREELIGLSVEKLVPMRFRGAHVGARQEFVSAPSYRTMGTGRQLFGLRKDGTEFSADIGLTHFDSAEGIIVLASIIDITDIKETENAVRKLNEDLRASSVQLEAANKELEAFAYSVSHDLRAPLRGIDGFSQALLEDYRDKLDDQGRDYLTRVRAASQKMARLIEDILSLSRVTRGEMKSEPVDLSRLANAVLSEIRSQDPDRKIECRIADGVTVRGDERLLRVAMENLLRNAWKFTSRKPEASIEFGVASNNGDTAFFVRDNGAGFDMAYADKLFGVFQRLHGVAEFDGTGVGLATVQRIIRRHGGRIWAEAAVDRGATFYFVLPMEAGR